MGFNFEEVDTSHVNEEGSGMPLPYEEFSQHCDALLHGRTAYELGFTEIPDKFRVLEQKGYFVPNFYMVNPLYYIGIEKFPIMSKSGCYVGSVKDGAIFIIIPEDDVDLEDLNVEIAKAYDPEVIVSLPVVLFRRCRKPINYYGRICDDWSADFSEKLHCKNDTSEFIGVFKAQRNGEAGGNNIYKMTKIFDRYYFDTTKIQTEIPEPH